MYKVEDSILKTIHPIAYGVEINGRQYEFDYRVGYCSSDRGYDYIKELPPHYRQLQNMGARDKFEIKLLDLILVGMIPNAIVSGYYDISYDLIAKKAIKYIIENEIEFEDEESMYKYLVDGIERNAFWLYDWVIDKYNKESKVKAKVESFGYREIKKD